MRVAKIYKPAKTAMQSGRGKTKSWVLEHPRASKVVPEPLMGWQSSADTARQVKLCFASSDAAIAYCRAHNLAFEVVKPNNEGCEGRLTPIISLLTVWAAGHISLIVHKDIWQFLLASDCRLDSMLSRDYNEAVAP